MIFFGKWGRRNLLVGKYIEVETFGKRALFGVVVVRHPVLDKKT